MNKNGCFSSIKQAEYTRLRQSWEGNWYNWSQDHLTRQPSDGWVGKSYRYNLLAAEVGLL